MIEVFTDGACRGNPGPGGWGALIRVDGEESCLSGSAAATTNNRMELMAAISALELLSEPCEAMLHSDSKYVVDALNKNWLTNWKKKGWKKSDKKPVLNKDLWQRLDAAQAKHKMVWKWVKGHAGNELNERCDELVHEAIDAGNLVTDQGYLDSQAPASDTLL